MIGEELSSVQAIPNSSFDLGTLTGSFAPLNGSGTADDVKQLIIFNGGSVGVDISYDGVTKHDFWPAGATIILDFQANHANQGVGGQGIKYLRKGQIIWGKNLNNLNLSSNEWVQMSQFHISSSSVPPPPSVPTTFTAQTGSAVPAANILLVNAYDSTENNDSGIVTKGGAAAGNPPGTGTANELDIYLTNRATGTVTTTDATPTVSLTFAMGATPGVYYFSGDIEGFDVTDTAGGAYSFVSAARTTGVAGVEIATEFKDVLEEAAMAASDIAVSVSGNNFLITVTGIAAKTINWNSSLNFRFVG